MTHGQSKIARLELKDLTIYQLSQLIGSFIAPLLLFGAMVYLSRWRRLALNDAVVHPLVIALVLVVIVANVVPAPR